MPHIPQLDLAEAERLLRAFILRKRQDQRRFPQLHTDASPVPVGLKPRDGVEYGCGRADCTSCYEPDPDVDVKDDGPDDFDIRGEV